MWLGSINSFYSRTEQKKITNRLMSLKRFSRFPFVCKGAFKKVPPMRYAPGDAKSWTSAIHLTKVRAMEMESEKGHNLSLEGYLLSLFIILFVPCGFWT